MLERAREPAPEPVSGASHGPSGQDDDGPESSARQATVLVYASDAERRDQMVTVIERAGWLPLVAVAHGEAVRIVRDAPPDLFLLMLRGTADDELGLLDDVRNTADGELVPIVCMLDRRHRALTIDAFGRRADDVVWGQPHPDELIARLRARIERRPMPTTELIEDPVTGALTPRALASQLSKEHERVARGGEPGALAFLSLDELPGITARRGSRARDQVLAQVVRLIKRDGRQLDFVGSRRGVIALLLPGTPTKGAQARLDRLARKIYDHTFSIDGESVALTPIIGFTESTPDATPTELEDRAWDAMAYQAAHLDLHPTRWVEAMSPKPSRPTSLLRRGFERVRTPVQVVSQQLIALGFPLATYVVFDRLGIDITGAVYLVIVIALAITATGIWIESTAALPATVPPEPRQGPLPPATAIIAAYLPNEAGTVIDTIEAFLGLDYPNLEIILAYNTPRTLPVEAELRRMADRDPRFRPMRVEGSASKAQNVNAALAHVRGHFVGLFDADHHPEAGSFQRAWQWIDNGAGVVQGHCVIRNGETNLVTRTVAVEFESIYAVSHPGRARVHGFGIFGGSNGYWRTSLLHRTRMRGSMLTEDIDSSMRVVESGETIISDPDLVSTELAPETLGALWNQRLRWAQGWSQVSIRHLVKMMRAAPTLRQRAGVFYLLGWREVYPWISLQVFPLLTYWWMRGESRTDWFVPIFVATTIFTMSVGPAQTWFAYRLAHPTIKRQHRWFLQYFALSTVFYTEFKNVVGRTAQVKEAMRERKWKVTPRTGSIAVDTGTAEVAEAETAFGEPETGLDSVTEPAPAIEPTDGRREAQPTPAPAVSKPERAIGRRSSPPDRHHTHREAPRRAYRPTGSPNHRVDRAHRRARRPTVYDAEREPTIYDVEHEERVARRREVDATVHDAPQPTAIHHAQHEHARSRPEPTIYDLEHEERVARPREVDASRAQRPATHRNPRHPARTRQIPTRTHDLRPRARARARGACRPPPRSRRKPCTTPRNPPQSTTPSTNTPDPDPNPRSTTSSTSTSTRSLSPAPEKSTQACTTPRNPPQSTTPSTNTPDPDPNPRSTTSSTSTSTSTRSLSPAPEKSTQPCTTPRNPPQSTTPSTNTPDPDPNPRSTTSSTRSVSPAPEKSTQACTTPRNPPQSTTPSTNTPDPDPNPRSTTSSTRSVSPAPEKSTQPCTTPRNPPQSTTPSTNTPDPDPNPRSTTSSTSTSTSTRSLSPAPEKSTQPCTTPRNPRQSTTPSTNMPDPAPNRRSATPSTQRPIGAIRPRAHG